MKSYAKMTDKEKASAVYELFPVEVIHLVAHCRMIAEEVHTGKRIIRKWLPHSAAASWGELADACLVILQDHQDEIPGNTLGFGNWLFRKRIIYFTRYCLENYIEYKYTTDERLIMAIRLFLL